MKIFSHRSQSSSKETLSSLNLTRWLASQTIPAPSCPQKNSFLRGWWQWWLRFTFHRDIAFQFVNEISRAIVEMLIMLFALCQDWKKCQQCQPVHNINNANLSTSQRHVAFPRYCSPPYFALVLPGHWEIYNWEIIENNNWRSLGGYEQALWWTRWLHACPSSLMISFQPW